MDEGNREEDIGGIGEPKGEGVESADGKNRGDVEIFGHGNGLDELEDADDYEGQGRTKGHVDHGEEIGNGQLYIFLSRMNLL